MSRVARSVPDAYGRPRFDQFADGRRFAEAARDLRALGVAPELATLFAELSELVDGAHGLQVTSDVAHAMDELRGLADPTDGAPW